MLQKFNGRVFLRRFLPVIKKRVVQLSKTATTFNGDYEYEDPKSENEIVQIIYVQRDGTERKVNGKIGDNAMYLAHR